MGITRYDGFHIDDYTDVVAAARLRFANRIRQIVGDANCIRLVLPARADTTTTTDLSKYAATCTWDATIATRLSQRGLAYSQTFASASTQYGQMPDAAEASFGNGTVDTAGGFTVLSLANITDTAATRSLFCKYHPGTGFEWNFGITSADKLSFQIRDNSAGVTPDLTTTASATMGGVHLFEGTYSAATGGATAANDIKIYEDGVEVAGTATNNASYVAMENTAGKVTIGVLGDLTTDLFDGSILMSLLVAGQLTAAQRADIKTAVNEFFGLSL